MTSTFRRLAALFPLLALAFGILTACGAGSATPVNYCVGPTAPDSLAELMGAPTERIRYLDDRCAGPLPAGFSIVSAPSWDAVPDVGELVDYDADWGYHRSYRPATQINVVHIVKERRAPKTYVLVTRDPTVGSPQVRAAQSSVAKQARKEAPPVVSTPPANPNVSRGGLGLSSGSAADKLDASTQKDRAAAAARAAEAGRKAAAARASSSSSSVKSSTSTSRSSSTSSASRSSSRSGR